MSTGPLDQIEEALAGDSSAHDVLDLVDEAIERATREADAVTLAALADRLDAVAASRGGEWGMLTIAAMRARALATPPTGSRVAPARDMAGNSRRVVELLPPLGIHVFGALMWVAFLGFSADIGSNHQFNEALGIGAATWLVAAALIAFLWLSGKSVRWTVGIPFAWWLPSYILMVSIVYDTPSAPEVTPPGALAPTIVSSQPQGTLPGTTSVLSGTTSSPSASGLCKRDGIRYTGTTAQGAEVCFTLTPDRSAWVEIGFSFVRASGCRDMAAGTNYSEGPVSLDAFGRINSSGFTAIIRPDDFTKASGVFADSDICPGKKFKWRARLQP